MARPQIDRVDDHALVLRVADGDVRAFEAIYDRYSAHAYGLAIRVTGRRRGAEEATQDAFLNLWRTAHRYDPERGTVRTWLLWITRNRSVDWLRREARHNRNVELSDVLGEQLESTECMEATVAEREQSTHARQMLGSLPAEQRQVIELAYFKGLTQTEIAAKVKIPLGTVKGRQRLALAKLQRALAGPATVAARMPDQVAQRPRRRAALLNP
jgi:RNA polymerase sigma-70 factor (ECF subfamily)